MDNLGTDFEQIKIRHLNFKTQLRILLYGGSVDETPITSYENSPVGKWIYGHALQAYGHISEMEQLQDVHKKIHKKAAELVTLYKHGEIDAARKGLIEVEWIADNFVLLLTIIKLKLEADQSPGNRKITQSDNYQEIQALSKSINEFEVRFKQQSEELYKTRKTSDLELRQYLEQVPIGICLLRGPDMVCELANELYLKLVGRDAEFIGKPLIESIPELKGQPFMGILDNVLKTATPYIGDEAELLIVRNGIKEKAFFNFIYQPMIEEDGSVAGIMVVCNEVTDTVKAKKKLEESEKKFRSAVKNSPVAMSIFRGPDFIIETGNDAMLTNLWRKKLEDVKGKSVLDVFPELREQKFESLLNEVMKTGITYSENEVPAYIDSNNERKDYYLDFEYLPLFEEDGSVSGIMATVHDVTAKVIAKRTLESTERKYRKLIEELPLPMYTIDKDGYIDLYNEAAIDLWQRKPEIGKEKWCGSLAIYSLEMELIPHDQCPMAIAVKEKRTIKKEVLIERPDGTFRNVIVHPRPLYDKDGEVFGALKVLTDITDRKEAEQALKNSEEKFRVLSDSMPQFVWTAQPSGELTYYSQSVLNYSGFTIEELMFDGWLKIVHPDDRDENVEKWMESIVTGKGFNFEHRFQRYDGEYRWQLSRAVPHRNDAGEIQMWIGTSTDIQDQKTFQQRLEKIVAERTKELKLTNIQLESTIKELSSFAYISSHDLQEPLRKIQTFMGMLQNTDMQNLSDSGKMNLQKMDLAAGRMRKLINDLLTYSRTSDEERVFEKTDLNVLFSEIKYDFADLLAEKNGDIHIGDMPNIKAITFQLRQLFTNLISNSVKFARTDVPLKIEISAQQVKGSKINHADVFPDQNYLKISIQDNGIGFSEEYNSRIFGVFQRLHNKSTYDGTGIGLAICKKITENHKGIIEAVGKPNEGATFDVYFPCE